MDFFGSDFGGVTAEAYAEVGKAFPKVDFYKRVNESLIWLCQTKPASTFDSWQQPWGDNHVPGYSTKGKRAFNNIFSVVFP